MSRQGVGVTLKTRIYLEGRLLENGMQSVFVGGNVGSPATASIALAPTNAMKHILPGTWVHIFTTDPWEMAPKGDLSDFKLLFEGVVVGRGFTRQDGGRAFTINCADPSIFWVEARQYWLNLASSGGGMVEQVAYQTSQGAGRFGTLNSSGHYGYMVSKISQIQEDQQERFFDTLLAVIDDIGNVNPYYTNNRNRFRITDRILRAHCGKVEKLFQLALLSDYLTGLANRVSGQSNLAEVVNALLEPILHEWVSVPAPPYVDARIFLRDIFGNIVRKKNETKIPDGSGRTATLFSYEMATEKIVASTIFKPDVYTLSPPTCNVLLPNMYDRQVMQENFLQMPTRLVMRPTLIAKGLDAASMGLLLMRPTELEIFTGLTRDLKKGSPGEIKKRSPDAHFGDAEGQTETFNDYDWGTNEERIRGIVYDFKNLAPAPGTLTMSLPGKRQPDGTRKGGMPRYLQGVASYEWYKARFTSRPTSVSGPYNMRPVPGFQMLLVDDSAANMSMMVSLRGINHKIDAQGNASTEYVVASPRMIDEVDLNQPRFRGGSDPVTHEALLELAKDEKGNFSFEKLFDGNHRPPIPEWFSDDYRTLVGLDQTYKQFFGPQVGVFEFVQFRGKKISGPEIALLDKISEQDGVQALIARYRAARDKGKEFEEAASLTARSMATIDQAFRFVGAAPVEFKGTAAEEREIDYAKAKFNTFVGDPSNGSGYDAAPELTNPSTSASAAKKPGQAETDLGERRTPQMGGSFPEFDAKVHVGSEATDPATRASLKMKESRTTSFARYDGRPVMYDFEYRLWQESVKAANVSQSSEEAEAARAAAAKFEAGPNGSAVPVSPKAQAAGAEKKKAADQAKAAGQKGSQQTKTMTADQQAPTGDGAEGAVQLPLPQPLSERQIVDLRRAVVDAVRKELENRGFTG